MKTFTQVKRWFEKQGIWELVCERIESHAGVSANYEFTHEGSNMINHGILWSDTPEGHGFWENIHDEFRAWFNSSKPEQNVETKPLFNQGQKVEVLNELQSEIVEINEEMTGFAGKTVTISYIDFFGYDKYDNNDGVFYYIKEDDGINVWTSELFKKK